MKALLKKITPQYLIDKYLKYRDYRNRYFDNKEALAYVYKKKQGLINHANEIETLGLRGSYADYDFFPGSINNSYNLGLTSTDVYSNYYLYLKCKEILPNLKNVVFYTAAFVSGMSSIRTKEKYRAIPYKYFFDIPYQEESLIDKGLEKKIFKKCRKIEVDVPNDYCGYETKDFFVTGADAESRAKILLRENRREPDQMIWIKKIIEQIIEDKKNIFIIIPPYHTKVKNYLPRKEELYKKIYALLNDYKELHNVRLIDLYDSDLINDSDMGDNEHLNEKGAKKCTMILKDYIEKQCLQ